MQRHGQDARGLVEVGDRDFKGAGHFCHAVAAGDRKAPQAGRTSAEVVLGCKQVWSPVQYGTGAVACAVVISGYLQGHAAWQAHCAPVDEVSICVAAKEFNAQRGAFGGAQLQGQGGVAAVGDLHAVDLHTQEFGCSVGTAHHHAQAVDGGVGHRRGSALLKPCVLWTQATIGHGDVNVMRAGIVGCGGPAQEGLTVLCERRKRGPDGQSGGAVAEGVLVHITNVNSHRKHLAHHGHHLAGRGNSRRFGWAGDRDDEGLGLGQHLVDVAVAIVLAHDRDVVVTTVSIAGGEANHTGYSARHCRRILGIGGKAGQTRDGKLDGVAVGVYYADRDFKHRAFGDKGVVDISNIGGTVGIADHDGQGDLADCGRACAVAVIGGGNGDRVGASLGITGSPNNLQSVGIKAGALRQAGNLVRHGGGRGF